MRAARFFFREQVMQYAVSMSLNVTANGKSFAPVENGEDLARDTLDNNTALLSQELHWGADGAEGKAKIPLWRFGPCKTESYSVHAAALKVEGAAKDFGDVLSAFDVHYRTPFVVLGTLSTAS